MKEGGGGWRRLEEVGVTLYTNLKIKLKQEHNIEDSYKEDIGV